MSTVPLPVMSALDALGARPGVSAILEDWSRPFEWLIVGLVASGKTTLANRLTGLDRPVGLGGVTRGVHPLECDGLVVVDTEGIDDPALAKRLLEEAAHTADGILWVVDGLAPSTARERSVIQALLAPGMPLHLLVSRGDLLEETARAEVLGRLRRLEPDAASLLFLDLRSDPLPPGVLDPPPVPRTRAERTRHALAEHVRALPPPLDTEDIGARIQHSWQQRVLAARDAVLADIEAGTLGDATQAEASLVRAAARERTRFYAALEAEHDLHSLETGSPDLPRLETAMHGRLATLHAGVAGRAGAERRVRERAGRWRLDGDAVLHDWCAEVLTPAIRRVEGRQARTRAACADAMAFLDTLL